jgi:pyruvate formate lyase activating enzyme
MLQADAALELAIALKSCGVEVLIDTAGCVPYSEFEKLNGIVQGYLFDFKTADPQKYKEIGGDLELVSENIKKLKNEKLELHIRIPLIPGFNTDLGSLEAICRHLEKTGIKEVELLPFHRLGTGKYQALGLEYKYAEVPMMDNSTFSKIAAVFLEKGFKVKREG